MLNNNCLESEVYMKRKIYESPLTLRTEVELEGYFCASIVDDDKEKKETISIQKQEVGAESDYFTNDSEWDF